MMQGHNVKAEMYRLLELATSTKEHIKLDKQTIYDMVQDKTKAPRPTIRRVARDVRNELQAKINILQEQSKKHGRPIGDRVALT